MAYRNIAYNKQKDNTKKKKNKKKIPSGIIDQRVQTYSMRKKKKKYTGTFKTRQPGIEAANIRPRELSFGATFKKHKAAGDKEFTWKGKKFHTKTKAELETGKSEKERFEKAAKSKKVPDNQSNWNKFKGSKTLAEFFRKIKK